MTHNEHPFHKQLNNVLDMIQSRYPKTTAVEIGWHQSKPDDVIVRLIVDHHKHKAFRYKRQHFEYYVKSIIRRYGRFPTKKGVNVIKEIRNGLEDAEG